MSIFYLPFKFNDYNAQIINIDIPSFIFPPIAFDDSYIFLHGIHRNKKNHIDENFNDEINVKCMSINKKLTRIPVS